MLSEKTPLADTKVWQEQKWLRTSVVALAAVFVVVVFVVFLGCWNLHSGTLLFQYRQLSASCMLGASGINQ